MAKSKRKLKKGRYAKLYGTFWRNNRVDLLGSAAVAWYCRALSFCADNQSDGFIPTLKAAGFIEPDRYGEAIERLTSTIDPINGDEIEPFIESIDRGFRILRYLDHQISKDDYERTSAAGKTAVEERERKRAERLAKDADEVVRELSKASNRSSNRSSPPSSDPRPKTQDLPRSSSVDVTNNDPPPNPPRGEARAVEPSVVTDSPELGQGASRAQEIIELIEDVHVAAHGVRIGLASYRDVKRALSVWAWSHASKPGGELALIRQAWERCVRESTADSPWAMFASAPGSWAVERKRGKGRPLTPDEGGIAENADAYSDFGPQDGDVVMAMARAASARKAGR